jgi:hypothetical protein
MQARQLRLHWAFFAMLLASAGCTKSSGGKCVPGATSACTCVSGASGAQTCSASGTSFGACQCAGNPNTSGDMAMSAAGSDGDMAQSSSNNGGGGSADLAPANGGGGGGGGGSGGNPDLAPSGGDSPIILSLTTNVTQLIVNSSLVVTAVVTHPQGIAQIIGGQLSDVASGGTYGAFQVSTTGGSYSLTLTWSAIQTVSDITGPIAGVNRGFRAQFFDQQGHSTTKDFTILLTCNDSVSALCSGICTTMVTDYNNCGSCGNSCSVFQKDYPGIDFGGCSASHCWGDSTGQIRESCQQQCASYSPPLSCNIGGGATFGGYSETLDCTTTPPATAGPNAAAFQTLNCNCRS